MEPFTNTVGCGCYKGGGEANSNFHFELSGYRITESGIRTKNISFEASRPRRIACLVVAAYLCYRNCRILLVVYLSYDNLNILLGVDTDQIPYWQNKINTKCSSPGKARGQLG